MTDPKPMDPKRLAILHAENELLVDELLADRDYQETALGLALARAELAENEWSELARGLVNLEAEMLGMDTEYEAMGKAGRVARAAASLMVTAVRLLPNVQNGIALDVLVDARQLEVIAQWTDAPARTNWVAFAGDVLRSKAEAERERDEARAEVTRLRSRVRIEAEDVERAGVTRTHVESWLLANLRWEPLGNRRWSWKPANGGAFTSLSDGNHRGMLADDVHWIAQREQRPGLDILDEMAAMQSSAQIAAIGAYAVDQDEPEA